MADYAYGDYVYFKKMTYTLNEHQNHFILNQIPDFHITSPSKLMDDIFESLPRLFVDRMQKMDEFTFPKFVSVIKSKYMEQIESTTGTNI